MVLLHGWPQTWWEWRHVIPALAKSHTVIAPDLRVLGDRSRPLTGYDKKTVVNDVWRLMNEVLGLVLFLSLGAIGAGQQLMNWRQHTQVL